MALIHTASVNVKIASVVSESMDLGGRSASAETLKAIAFANGTGAGQANLEWTDERTLAGAANEDLDLAAVLTSAFGAALTFVKLKLLYIEALTTNLGTLTISRPNANGVPLFGAANDALAALGAGGIFLVACPTAAGLCTITAATADLINIANSAGGESKYKIVMLGTDA